MATNIYRFYRYVKGSKDVFSAGSKKKGVWEYAALSLLIFFFIGYILVAILGKPDLVIAGILFGGSIFVALVLSLLFYLTATIKENALNIAETLISVVDARDPNLRGHSRYVQNVTMALYDHLPQEKKEGINRVSLEFGALMHDVGKLGIPEEILNKPGPLDDQEWAIMKNHPRLSRKIMQPLKSLQEILPWVEFHHERIDGKGYYGLKEQDIPYASKIIAVADTYSAITMKRSYKPSRSYEEAIEVMKEASGTQLDKELMEVFSGIPKEDLLSCVPEGVEV
ncbi:MAG: HD domain-containing protein [Lachnospiraceae bacterium]|nr:HD domain-containing protein [Lachnospiraceae bacterium]